MPITQLERFPGGPVRGEQSGHGDVPCASRAEGKSGRNGVLFASAENSIVRSRICTSCWSWTAESRPSPNTLYEPPSRSGNILRRRFSFAHEYAHVLLDRELKAILSHARDRSSLMEVRANAFAASFLMPAEGVRRYVNALSKGLGESDQGGHLR